MTKKGSKYRISALKIAGGILTLVLALGCYLYYSGFSVFEAAGINATGAADSSEISFSPTPVNIAAGGKAQLIVHTGKPLVFAQVSFTFDKSVLQLANEIEISHPYLTRYLKISTAAEANQTGRVVIAAGVDPAHKEEILIGDITLATVYFKAVGSQAASSVLAIDPSASQLVDNSTSVIAYKATNGSVNVNQKNNESAASPKSSSAPQNKSGYPVISITSPEDGVLYKLGDKKTVTAVASDDKKVKTVAFRVNGSLKCKDTEAPYTCDVTANRWLFGRRVRITARAYDEDGHVALDTVYLYKNANKKR